MVLIHCVRVNCSVIMALETEMWVGRDYLSSEMISHAFSSID